MLIDLSSLQDVEIDPAASTAIVRPAVEGQVLNAALAEHGLMFPTGHCPDVGIGVFLLNGGWGWNSRAWGRRVSASAPSTWLPQTDGWSGRTRPPIRNSSEPRATEALASSAGSPDSTSPCGPAGRFRAPLAELETP
ncbi:FAD-binding protein [Micromonospora sp. ATCC 39149]|uniref:FAD-binding protein n=1 Tax=Micromonospora carbonacea TaxID=47853 RepID=A0A7D5Y8I2_9ACTN|nr:FAD-binding protein [Micromonospora sp. ATCC 39149]QLJ98499.1 FAD-binding protein [Micromonospora carbonacea]